MAKTSFIERMKPHAERSKLIEWPFEGLMGGEKVRVKILGAPAIGMASREARDFFKREKAKPTEGELTHRERAEVVFRAFEDPSGDPLGSVEELYAEAPAVINALYAEWDKYQAEVSVAPLNAEQMRELVEELKKNTPLVPLHAFPSSWLIGLISTLADELKSSTPDSSDGS